MEYFIVYETDNNLYIAPEGMLKFCKELFVYFSGTKEECRTYIDNKYGNTQER